MVIALVEVYRQKGDYAKDVSEFWEVLRPVLGKMIGIVFDLAFTGYAGNVGLSIDVCITDSWWHLLGIAAISILWYINSAIYASFIAIRYQVSIWDSIKSPATYTKPMVGSFWFYDFIGHHCQYIP